MPPHRTLLTLHLAIYVSIVTIKYFVLCTCLFAYPIVVDDPIRDVAAYEQLCWTITQKTTSNDELDPRYPNFLGGCPKQCHKQRDVYQSHIFPIGVMVLTFIPELVPEQTLSLRSSDQCIYVETPQKYSKNHIYLFTKHLII